MRSPTELRPALSTACASEMLAFRIWSKSSNFTLSMLFRSNTPAPGSCESVNARNQNSRHLGFGVFGYPPKTCVRKNLITHAGPRLKPCRLSPPPSTYWDEFWRHINDLGVLSPAGAKFTSGPFRPLATWSIAAVQLAQTGHSCATQHSCRLIDGQRTNCQL